MKALVLALALVACSKSKQPPAAGSGSAPTASTAAAGSGSAGSADVIPPYEPAADVPIAIRGAIAAPDRSVDDRKLDAGRKPGEVLAFFRVAPGQKIGELVAGGGYTSELLARTVGDQGKVFSQNTKEMLDRFARKPWTERIAKPIMKNVVSIEQPLETPLPPEAKDLDAVITVLNYHDTVWMKVDRAKMNAAVFAALKSGGVYGIVDSSAKEGTLERDAQTLHRIDEDLVKQEVRAAGFQLDSESDVLRNPADTRDWNSSPKAAGERRGTSDRFVLRFIKP